MNVGQDFSSSTEFSRSEERRDVTVVDVGPRLLRWTFFICSSLFLSISHREWRVPPDSWSMSFRTLRTSSTIGSVHISSSPHEFFRCTDNGRGYLSLEIDLSEASPDLSVGNVSAVPGHQVGPCCERTPETDAVHRPLNRQVCRVLADRRRLALLPRS